MTPIKPMMKINLTFTAATGPGKSETPLDHSDYEFVFGIGSGGLTPFEYELAEKQIGDLLDFHLRQTEMRAFFEHLYPPVLGLFLDYPELYLSVRINSVEKARNREIIKAMAEMTSRTEGSCSCGGSCGCG